MLTKRDFHGESAYVFMMQAYEQIRQRRKALKGKPDQYQRVDLELDKVFESFYRSQMD